MSLNAASIDLANAMKTAREVYQDARTSWDDAVARDFEEHTWEPLEAQVLMVLQSLDRLTPVVNTILRECS